MYRVNHFQYVHPTPPTSYRNEYRSCYKWHSADLFFKSSHDPFLNYSPAVKPRSHSRNPPATCTEHHPPATHFSHDSQSRQHWRDLTSHSCHAVLQADHSRLRLGELLGVVAVPIIRGAAALYSSQRVVHREQTLLFQTQGGFEGRRFRVDAKQQVLR